MTAYKEYTIWLMADGRQRLMANMCTVLIGTKEEVAKYMKEHDITLAY